MKIKEILFKITVFCIVFSLSSCVDENYVVPHLAQFWAAPMEFDDSGATRSLNVAAVGFDVALSPEVNRNKIVYFIDKIKLEQPDVRLILFPEITLGYYYRKSNPEEYQRSIAEPIPGETTSIISQKAMEHQLYISFGMAEKSGDDIFISQVLIGPDGTIESVYRKKYLTPFDRESGFKAGQEFIMNIIDNIKVATIICMDFHDIRINRRIHESGAELVLLPVANANSFFNAFNPRFQIVYTWVLSANRYSNEDGIKYDGLLYLSSPGGNPVVKSIEKKGYIYGVVRLW